MPRINHNITKTIGTKTYQLDATHLYLHTDYTEVYNMDYLSYDRIKSDIPFETIKQHFNQFNMAKYFGSRKDLNCEETRSVYNEMILYFINLLEFKMNIVYSKNAELFYDLDSYTCILAKCAHFIRGSIKKYIRNRTALNQASCRKETLERRDAREYGCPYPIPDDYICPTLTLLMSKEGATCAKVFASSKRIDKKYTGLSILSTLVNPRPTNTVSRTLSVAIPRDRTPKLRPRSRSSIKLKSKAKKRITYKNTNKGTNLTNLNFTTYV